MFTGFVFVLFMTICAAINLNINNKNFSFRNLHLFLVSLITGAFIFIRTFDFNAIEIDTSKFNFFQDPWFLIYVIITFFTQQISSKFVKYNEKNLIYVQLANFIFIGLVPLISFIFIYYFNFKESINIKYQSFFEVLIFSFSLISVSFFIFAHKLKNNSIKRIDLMIYYLLLSSTSFVLNTKLMQIYDAETFYLTSMIIFSFNWFLISIKNKEYSIIQQQDFKFIFLATFIYIVYSYINILVVKILPSEFIAIFRTVTGIFVFALFDYYKNKKNNISKIDFFSIILIFIIIYFFNFDF